MSDSEKLQFSITIGATMWDKLPHYSIWLNDHAVIQTEASSAEQTHKFVYPFPAEPRKHTIKIRLDNKEERLDTITHNGEIVRDMLLHIRDITIEDVSMGPLLWDGKYILDQPHEYNGQLIKELDRCIDLGWNGTYIFEFETPFRIWLSEKL